MKRKEILPELLAPAGDFECLVAAVNAGADAVYVGMQEFSARAFAKNFSLDELERALAYCHIHGVRLYVTVNTLLTTKELKSALALAEKLYMLGVDALICADLGFVKEVHKFVPKLELHASTQMSVHNSLGADAAYRLGCTRVVLARELSERDIAATVENTRAECEIFLHGALCVSHSGQCLFSSLVGGRSGNRGECAQPCRLNYGGKDKYPLSLKDLSLAMHVPTLIKSGVSSLKIEGRMKSPTYVYTVTKIYRRLLDENRAATEKEFEELKNAFSRTGFTDGYYTAKTERGMTGVRTEADMDKSRSLEVKQFVPLRQEVNARAEFKLGKPSSLTLTLKNGGRVKIPPITAYGAEPSKALTSALEGESLKLRLSKMGNTFLSLSTSDIELELDDGVNLSVSQINALRRKACDLLEYYGRDLEYVARGDFEIEDAVRGFQVKRTALFLDPLAYSGVANCEYFDVCFLPLDKLSLCNNIPNGVYVPPVILEHELPRVKKMLAEVKGQGVKYALCGNIGAVELVKSVGLIPIGDFRLNAYNSSSLSVLYGMGVYDVIVSCELSYAAASSLGAGAVVYGRIPLMLTERCFIKENFGCDKCNSARLVDRKGMAFPIMREFGHRNLILNSAVTYMADKLDRVQFMQHFIFSTESAEEVNRVVDAYKNKKSAISGMPLRRLGRRD